MAWNPLNEPQDFVDFAGQRTPGIAVVLGVGTPRRWEERESRGYSGAFLVYTGHKLSHFSIQVRLYSDQDWLDWYAFKPLVDKVPLGKRQGPIDVTHPQLAHAGIRSAVVDDVLAPVPERAGVWLVELKMIEYRSPRVALAAAQGSTATPADPEDAIIAANKEQIDELANDDTP